MTEDERGIYEMVLSLAAHQAHRGQNVESSTSNFIAKEIAKGTHRQPHEGWRNHPIASATP